MKGEAVVEWSETEGRRSRTYRGEEKYLNSVTYLFGSKDGDIIEVPAGIHTYNFACKLPIPIPYSVEGEFGYVRYNVDANLDIPWSKDLHTEKRFIVIRHEDLNFFPDLLSPCEFKEIKTFCCLCFRSHPLTIKIRLPKTGFVSGEIIPITVELINRSNTDILNTTFALKKVKHFITQTPFEKIREKKEKVAKMHSWGVKAGKSLVFKQLLQIPQSLMISSNQYCKVLQITYELEVTFEPKGFSSPSSYHIPITIGTVGSN